LAYRLGLISPALESFLQTLRRLRNDAAHAVQQIDLSTSPHLDRIIHLQSLASKSSLWQTLVDEPINPKTNPGASLFVSLAIAVFDGESVVRNSKPFVVDVECDFGLVKPPQK
jgi:hypothetical protein